jgi:hypothetical protein
MKNARLFSYKKLRQTGIRSIIPLIFKVGAGYNKSSASLSGHIGFGENDPLLTKLEGVLAPAPVWAIWRRKYFLLLTTTAPLLLGCAARILITIPTVLLRYSQ